MSTSVDHSEPHVKPVFEWFMFREVPQDRRLTLGWGRVVALGWFLALFALICVGASSQIVGRPVVWLDDQRWNTAVLIIAVLAACLPAMTVAIWTILRGPWVGYFSLIPTIDLFILAILDRNNSPGCAVVTLVLGIAAALLTVGAFAGRYRLSSNSSSVTASS